jgi:hypothetical protein
LTRYPRKTVRTATVRMTIHFFIRDVSDREGL